MDGCVIPYDNIWSGVCGCYVLWKVVGVSGKIYSDVGSCWLMAFQKVEDDVQYLVMSAVVPPVAEGLIAVVQYIV